MALFSWEKKPLPPKQEESLASIDNIQEKERDLDKPGDEAAVVTASGFAATNSARISTEAAAKQFAKPETYTGNRTLYDSGSAKINAKKALFKSGKDVIDPYTGEKLVLTKQEAKLLYGEEWQRHLAESDHVKPLEKIFEETKSNPWATTDDIKSAANSDDNIRVSSRKFNNPKRSRTNKEYAEDTEYLESKGVKLTKAGKEAAIKDGEIADASIKAQLKKASIKNVVKTGHEAGKLGAQNAGVTAATMSGIMNVTAVINGEKTPKEALIDTAADSGKAAATGYLMGGGLTTISHTLTASNSTFLKALSESNVPGKVITAVMMTGNTLKRYGNGEITTQECIIELGEKGLNFATAGYSMAVGQALIPIPIVGAAVGALVGSMATSKFYNELITQLKFKEYEHQERLRIISECALAAEQHRQYRLALDSYLSEYFRNYQNCFDSALSEIQDSFQLRDADGIIFGANKITRKLGGKVNFDSVQEFKSFLTRDSIDQF